MNYYETLGINQNADANEVKGAYYAAVKRHSPEKDPEKFKEIRYAYEVLSKPAKRIEYDKLFQINVTDSIRQEILITRDLLNNHQYKEVVHRLTKSKNPKFDNNELNLMLVEAYLGIGKTGTADSLAKKVLEIDPGNARAISLLTSSYAKKGYVNKADEYFLEWLEKNPDNPTVWNLYFDHLVDNFPSSIKTELNRAFDLSKASLKGHSYLYLVGCGSAYNADEVDRAVEFLDEYVKCLAEGINFNEEDYIITVNSLLNFAQNYDLRHIATKAIPYLHQSKHKSLMSDELNKLDLYAEWTVLSKEAIDDVFFDYTELLLIYDGSESCKNERGAMELYIINNSNTLRSNVLIIKKNYPKIFNLNPKFFENLLDAKKEDALLSQGAKTYKQLAKSGAFDGMDDFVVEKPYVRETPKVGRNAPCPCGSGKKFKHCCI